MIPQQKEWSKFGLNPLNLEHVKELLGIISNKGWFYDLEILEICEEVNLEENNQIEALHEI